MKSQNNHNQGPIISNLIIPCFLWENLGKKNNGFPSSILFSFTTKSSWLIVCQGQNSYSAQNSSFELCNLEDSQKCFAWYHLEGRPYITYYRRGIFFLISSWLMFLILHWKDYAEGCRSYPSLYLTYPKES